MSSYVAVTNAANYHTSKRIAFIFLKKTDALQNVLMKCRYMLLKLALYTNKHQQNELQKKHTKKKKKPKSFMYLIQVQL